VPERAVHPAFRRARHDGPVNGTGPRAPTSRCTRGCATGSAIGNRNLTSFRPRAAAVRPGDGSSRHRPDDDGGPGSGSGRGKAAAFSGPPEPDPGVPISVAQFQGIVGIHRETGEVDGRARPFGSGVEFLRLARAVYRSGMLDRLRNNARACALLAGVFDFDITRLDPVEPVRLASGGELHAVAGDASGGTFFVCGDGPVLYAGSEGTAGIVAADPGSAIRLVIGVPTWQDVVSYAPDPGAMRAAFESSYAELKEHEPRIDQLRSEVSAELELDQVAVEELLASLSVSLTELSPGYVLLNEDGDEYDPL